MRAVLFVLSLLTPALSSPSAAAVARCLVPPVVAEVVDPFRMPPCPYCPGNRGIEYATEPGATIRAAAGGVVTFAGVVAGTRYVVVEHADGVHATYGRLAGSPLERGDRVIAAMAVGTASDRLYFGLRNGDDPVDPTPLLGTWRWRTRLIPVDGGPRRRVPAPVLTCRMAVGER